MTFRPVLLIPRHRPFSLRQVDLTASAGRELLTASWAPVRPLVQNQMLTENRWRDRRSPIVPRPRRDEGRERATTRSGGMDLQRPA